MTQLLPFGLHAYRSRAPEETLLMKLAELLRGWHAKCVTSGAGEERLPPGTLTLTTYAKPGNEEWEPAHGLEIDLPYEHAVTWPWIELYSCARRTFAKKDRFSFHFFHPPPQKASPP